MDLQLQDRVVIVVGGAGYIGAAITDRLRAEGATVVVASRSGGAEGADSVALDATDDDSVSAGIAAVLERHGRIDGLVVTAAPSAGTLDPARNADPAQVLQATDAKALGFLRVANAVLPSMRSRGSGRVVVISGQNAWLTGSVTAAVRNAATNVIAKNLADAVSADGITVNVVNPGTVTDQPAAEVEAGRGGESSPQQIADLVAFLTSPLCVVSGESIAIGLRVKGVATV
jgi:NAD(P)-dependent dehydrogenase (short-subunit alcohol dehydrogenase family)